MNWRREAKERLRQYTALEAAMDNIPQELLRLEQEAVGLSKGPLEGNTQLRKALSQSLMVAKASLDTTDRAMAALSEEERQLLRSMYICPEIGNVDQLCEDLSLEVSSVYRRRDKALDHFTLAMYGTLKS